MSYEQLTKVNCAFVSPQSGVLIVLVNLNLFSLENKMHINGSQLQLEKREHTHVLINTTSINRKIKNVTLNLVLEKRQDSKEIMK